MAFRFEEEFPNRLIPQFDSFNEVEDEEVETELERPRMPDIPPAPTEPELFDPDRRTD
jgi:hypothetical protein